MSFFQELKRRNVFRVSVAYAIAAWVLLQIIDVVVPIIEAPDWVPKAILLMIAVGLPVAVLFAWAFELTPDGLKFERDVDRSQSVTPNTGRKLDRTIITILVVAVVLFTADKFFWSAATSEETLASKRSIAVLPFVNMSDDPEQTFFSDGISEEILNTLVRAEGISVASRTSSFGYRNHEQNIPAIAEALGVLFVLEGSVRKAGDQLRITAQLIDAENDRHLWSETYDRGLSDVFAVQSDIANSISRAIHSKLGIETASEISVKKLTDNMTAYDLYLKGSAFFYHRESLQDMQDSRAQLELAVEADPEFAAAWEVLSAVYSAIPVWGDTEYTSEKYLQLSTDAADRALELDPDLGFALAVKAVNATSSPANDQVGSAALFEQALRKDARNATTLHWHGMLLQLSGFLDEGIAYHRQCLEIDPAYVNCAFYIEQGLHAQGEHAAAAAFSEPYFEKADWSHFTAVRVALFMLSGERLAALIGASQIVGLEGAPTYEYIRALEDPDGDHSEGLAKLDSWAADNGVALEEQPEILAAFGAYDRVDNMLNSELWYWLPVYSNYRKSPQFREMIRDLGYYDLWKAKGFPPRCRPIGDDDFACD